MKKSLRERQLDALFAEQSRLQAKVARMRPVVRAAMFWDGAQDSIIGREQLRIACAKYARAARKGKAK